MDLTFQGKKTVFRCVRCDGITKRRGTRKEAEESVGRALQYIGDIAHPRAPLETLEDYNKREVMRLRAALFDALPTLHQVHAESFGICMTCYREMQHL